MKYILIFLALTFISCEREKSNPVVSDTENTPPEIIKLIAEPNNLLDGDTARVYCQFSDGNIDDLEFVWTTTSGYIEYFPSHDTIKYTPVNIYGLHYVALELRDGKFSTIDTIDITHSIRGNENDFIPIPAGAFFITAYEGLDEGYVTYEAYVDNDYQIMRYEVTNSQYTDFLNSQFELGFVTVVNDTVFGLIENIENIADGIYPFYNPPYEQSSFNNIGLIQFDGIEFSITDEYSKHPVSSVSWFGAKSYAHFNNYRLPTENEWIRAARGGDKRDYPWGNKYPNCEISNFYYQCEYGTSEIGVKTERSPFGICDLFGNVSEWITDNRNEYPYRRMCGKGYIDHFSFDYVWNCYDYPEFAMYPRHGFRCVKDN